MVSKPLQTPDEPDTSPAAKRLQLSPFLESVWHGDIAAVRARMEENVDIINKIDPRTGMNGLHLAVGRGNFEMTKLLVERGAAFVPDGDGRLPSYIAVEMEVSDELADYICEAESRAIMAEKPEGV